MTIRGSCLCGAVTFELDRVTGPFELCHCSRCRKVSGGTVMAAVGVNRQDYRFLTGHDVVRKFAAPILHEPPAYTVVFCNNCGSPVPEPNPRDEWFEIPAGLLDDDPGLRPDKHIFVELLPAWDQITDALPCFTRKQLIEHRRSQRGQD